MIEPADYDDDALNAKEDAAAAAAEGQRLPGVGPIPRPPEGAPGVAPEYLGSAAGADAVGPVRPAAAGAGAAAAAAAGDDQWNDGCSADGMPPVLALNSDDEDAGEPGMAAAAGADASSSPHGSPSQVRVVRAPPTFNEPGLVINGAYAEAVCSGRKTVEVRSGGAKFPKDWAGDPVGRTCILVQNKRRGPPLALGRVRLLEKFDYGQGMAGYLRAFDDEGSQLQATCNAPPMLPDGTLMYTHPVWTRTPPATKGVGKKFWHGWRLQMVERFEPPVEIASVQGPTNWWGVRREEGAGAVPEPELGAAEPAAAQPSSPRGRLG
eukprot:gene4032-1069_t